MPAWHSKYHLAGLQLVQPALSDAMLRSTVSILDLCSVGNLTLTYSSANETVFLHVKHSAEMPQSGRRHTNRGDVLCLQILSSQTLADRRPSPCPVRFLALPELKAGTVKQPEVHQLLSTPSCTLVCQAELETL